VTGIAGACKELGGTFAGFEILRLRESRRCGKQTDHKHHRR
jgi:hypothetical protein